MRVIDFRLRPPTEEYKASFRGFDVRLGVRQSDAWYNSNLEDCLKEMEESDISAVIMGRQTPPSMAVSNDHIKQLADRYPQRFIPIAGIDPTNRRACQDEIDRTAELGFKGVHFDHGLLDPPMSPNDSRLYPIYAQCEDLNLIVCLQIGLLAGDDLSYTSPLPVDQVAKDFPRLQIVLAHGCWPFIDDAIAVMWKRPNVWLSPDAFQFQPGGTRYVELFNVDSRFQDRYLYASSYPAGPGIKARLEQWKSLPWNETIVEKLLYKNAARLLGLES